MEDINDVENAFCTNGCFPKNEKVDTQEAIEEELERLKMCSEVIHKCIEFRLCEKNCMVSSVIVPYEKAKTLPPILNPCLRMVSECNYRTNDNRQRGAEMGNRSSSHYPPPPHWMHPPQRTSYSTTASPYPEAKRPIEPYRLNPRRSMISLNNADSGYVPSSDSERLREMRGSRMSLNQVDFEAMHRAVLPPRIIMPPDAKTLKKLEKMERKHQKLLKKLGAKGIPIGMPIAPPPHLAPPIYSRALSYDELNRLHESDLDHVRMRPRDWRRDEERRGLPGRRETQSQYVKHNYSTNRRTEVSGSLASSSPMTSSEEGGHSSDPWNHSSISSGRNNHRDVISPPMYTSTPHQHIPVSSPQNPAKQHVAKSIEVKIEQIAEKPIDVHQQKSATYAQPIIRGQPNYGSRTSSIATSQIRCDQSEIDFSWVNEEEDRLKNESRKKAENQLPECYFGMEPPKVEEKENEMEHRRRITNVHQKAAAFELEAKRADRKEPGFLSRSTHHLTSSDIPHPDYSPLQVHTKDFGGPSERRIYRIQKQSDRSEDRRYRSSIAF